MKKQRGVSKVLYATGDILGGGSFMIISLLFLNFLTNVQLINPATAGLIVMVGKFVDGGVDPLLGYLSDRTRSRFGRRRIYFLMGIVPVFITFTLLWSSFAISSEAGVFVYYLAMYCLFCISYSSLMVPYNALMPEMVTDYDQRTSFMGARMAFSIGSSLLAGVLPTIIIGRFADVKTGYMAMAVGFGLLYALPWLLVFFTSKEKYSDLPPEPMNPFKQMGLVFKNRTFRYYITMFLFGMAGSDLLTTLAIYYLTVCLEIPGQFAIVMGALMLSQLVASQVWTQVAKRTNKTLPIKIGVPLQAAGLLLGFTLTPASPGFLIYIVAVLAGFGGITLNQVPWNVLPDVVDVGELITGHRQEGIYSGMVTFSRQLAQALVLGLAGLLLEVIGYVVPQTAGGMAVQSAGTVMGIRVLFCLAPLLFAGVALVMGFLYPLARKRFDSMRTARDLLAAGKPLEDPDLKADVYALTGVQEDKLWDCHTAPTKS